MAQRWGLHGRLQARLNYRTGSGLASSAFGQAAFILTSGLAFEADVSVQFSGSAGLNRDVWLDPEYMCYAVAQGSIEQLPNLWGHCYSSIVQLDCFCVLHQQPVLLEARWARSEVQSGVLPGRVQSRSPESCYLFSARVLSLSNRPDPSRLRHLLGVLEIGQNYTAM